MNPYPRTGVCTGFAETDGTRSNNIKTFHIIGSSELGGAESFFVRMVEALARAGHETVAVSRRGGPISDLLSPQVKQICLPFANKWDYWTRWQIARAIRDERPAVVQTYMSRATRLTRLPPGSDAAHIARLGGYYTIRGNYEHAHAWVGNTAGVCDYLVQQGLPAGRIFNIGNFVPQPREVSPAELQALRTRLAVPEGALVVFALGRMIEKKGFQDLIAAFAMLPAAHAGRPLVLVLAGDGAERARYEELAAQSGVGERVKFAGWQEDPLPFFRLADLFVCPSRHEPLGNILLEAWTYGLPVLSTENDGARELVGGSGSALLVPVANPGALAAGLQRLLALDGRERQVMLERGRETARAHSEDAVIAKYIQLYGEVRRLKGTRAA